jgi:hypothetical protein
MHVSGVLANVTELVFGGLGSVVARELIVCWPRPLSRVLSRAIPLRDQHIPSRFCDGAACAERSLLPWHWRGRRLCGSGAGSSQQHRSRCICRRCLGHFLPVDGMRTQIISYPIVTRELALNSRFCEVVEMRACVTGHLGDGNDLLRCYGIACGSARPSRVIQEEHPHDRHHACRFAHVSRRPHGADADGLRASGSVAGFSVSQSSG